MHILATPAPPAETPDPGRETQLPRPQWKLRWDEREALSLSPPIDPREARGSRAHHPCPSPAPGRRGRSWPKTERKSKAYLSRKERKDKEKEQPGPHSHPSCFMFNLHGNSAVNVINPTRQRQTRDDKICTHNAICSHHCRSETESLYYSKASALSAEPTGTLLKRLLLSPFCINRPGENIWENSSGTLDPIKI